MRTIQAGVGRARHAPFVLLAEACSQVRAHLRDPRGVAVQAPVADVARWMCASRADTAGQRSCSRGRRNPVSAYDRAFCGRDWIRGRTGVALVALEANAAGRARAELKVARLVGDRAQRLARAGDAPGIFDAELQVPGPARSASATALPCLMEPARQGVGRGGADRHAAYR